jgi:hypothetical protein
MNDQPILEEQLEQWLRELVQEDFKVDRNLPSIHPTEIRWRAGILHQRGLIDEQAVAYYETLAKRSANILESMAMENHWQRRPTDVSTPEQRPRRGIRRR